MKKLIITGILLMVVLTVSIAAYAKDQTAGSMEVIYEYIVPSDGSGDRPGNGTSGGETEDTTSYIVNIPASVNIVDEINNVTSISIIKNDIAVGKKVAVGINFDKSGIEDWKPFYLYKNKGYADEEKMPCSIILCTETGRDVQTADTKSVQQPYIAEFPAGSLTPSYGGFLRFRPVYFYSGLGSGTYKASLYFDISVVEI